MIEKTIGPINGNNETIGMALEKEGVYVVGIGPPSCLRILYFRAMKSNLLNKFIMFPLQSIDVISGSYENRLIDTIESMINELKDVKGIILYLSCSEILTGMKFDKTINKFKNDYNIPIEILMRGPLVRRKDTPKNRMQELIRNIDEYI